MSDEDSAANENAAILQEFAERGLDLSIERVVDFQHLLPDAAAAEAFGERAAKLGFTVAVIEPDEEDLEEGFTDWDVVCTRPMVPDVASITRAEATLADLAAEFGGNADGWGFYE